MSKAKHTEEEKNETEIVDGTETSPAQEHPAEDPKTDGLALEEQLEASREEARKNWDLYLRSRADLDNYRKRAQREREDVVRFGQENLLRELLPVIDNLERAVSHARDETKEGESLLAGVELTLTQLRKTLERAGVQAFNATGEPFDPSRHEAMGQLESADQKPNTVVQELQKGYLLNDRLLRPALVMVAKAPVPEPEKNDE